MNCVTELSQFGDGCGLEIYGGMGIHTAFNMAESSRQLHLLFVLCYSFSVFVVNIVICLHFMSIVLFWEISE